MEKYTEKDIKWLLNLHKGSGRSASIDAPPKPGRTWKQWTIRLSLAVSAILCLVIFPFFLLIRFSVYLNLNYGLGASTSLTGGILATILLLCLYLLLVSFKVSNKKLLIKIGGIGIGTMVLGYCLFSLFYLSSVNAKSGDVQDVYRSMHPILRVAVSTMTLADSDLVITDIERVQADYGRMRLPVNQTSLHYRQENGYVHAVDIRTIDRGFIRNALLRGSLEVMGFRTIRHVGTADHLHVELR
ncbi:hypothetical protein [Rhodohalobacter sp. 8-1]|uniref:hypothetical protein n=1 Tax=Rhodohalobacter sp. 8-1 TaxID=3131972 RepID=UPI0030EB89D8